MTVKERYRLTIEWFKTAMPVAETELHYTNTFQLLVAVILSAQCTDKRINMVTPPLFEAYPDAHAMNKAAMAVDTHVFRVSERIGLTTGSKSPLQTEKTLCANIPEELIPKAHHWLILHGRYVCKARRPDCLNCGLTGVCRYYRQENK